MRDKTCKDCMSFIKSVVSENYYTGSHCLTNKLIYTRNVNHSGWDVQRYTEAEHEAIKKQNRFHRIKYLSVIEKDGPCNSFEKRFGERSEEHTSELQSPKDL